MRSLASHIAGLMQPLDQFANLARNRNNRFLAPMPMESLRKGKAGIIRLRNALGYSLQGLQAAFRHEDAFRQEVALAIVLIPVALLIEAGGVGRALMIGSILLVLIVELVNSAIEATVDRISTGEHPLAKRAKDIGSAAVFTSLVNVVVTWALVLSG